MGVTFCPQARRFFRNNPDGLQGKATQYASKKATLGGAQCLWQYRIILSADTASEVRQLLSQKRR